MGRVKGVVFLFWKVNSQAFFHRNAAIIRDLIRIRDCTPIKVSAYHYCHFSPVLKVATELQMFLPAIKDTFSVRYFRSHFGTEQECKYRLLEYGIPVDTLPLQGSGTMGRPYSILEVQKWIVKRMQIDASKKQQRQILASERSPPLLSGSHLTDMLDEENVSLTELFDESELFVKKKQDSTSKDLLCDSVASFEVDDISEEGTDSVASSRIDESDKVHINEKDDDAPAKRIRLAKKQDSTSKDLLYDSVASFEVDDINEEGTANIAPSRIDENDKIHINEKDDDAPAKNIRLATAETSAMATLGPFGVTTESPGTTINEPDISPQDILLGQSRKLRKHKGNQWCIDLVSKHYKSYFLSDIQKEQKTEIAMSIVRAVNSSGGRFLKQITTSSTNGTIWVVAKEKEARDKVSNTFRNIKKKEARDKVRNNGKVTNDARYSSSSSVNINV